MIIWLLLLNIIDYPYRYPPKGDIALIDFDINAGNYMNILFTKFFNKCHK